MNEDISYYPKKLLKYTVIIKSKVLTCQSNWNQCSEENRMCLGFNIDFDIIGNHLHHPCLSHIHTRLNTSYGVSWFPGGGHGNPLQYSCLDNPLDRGAWLATVQRVRKSQTWLKWLSPHMHGVWCTLRIGSVPSKTWHILKIMSHEIPLFRKFVL